MDRRLRDVFRQRPAVSRVKSSLKKKAKPEQASHGWPPSVSQAGRPNIPRWQDRGGAFPWPTGLLLMGQE